MTNKQLAVKLLLMTEPGENEKNEVLIQSAARLLLADIESAEADQGHAKEEKKEKKEQKKTEKKGNPKKRIDWGKADACRKAGWPISKIADELGCSETAIYAHFKKLGGWKAEND